jgi:hypothetical protein
MQTRKRAVAADDKVVPTAVAKRDWFLKASDLTTLSRVGGGAAWGIGRFPTYYSVKDLDRLALRVHGGAAGLAKKKAARAKRLENKAQKATKKKRPVVAPKAAKRESEEEIDTSSGKRSANTKKKKRVVSPRSLGDPKPKKGQTKPKQREQPEGTKEKRVVVDVIEEEVEFSGKRRSARKWSVSDVMESVHDDDADGDFNPAKRLSSRKGKSGKRLRLSGIEDV